MLFQNTGAVAAVTAAGGVVAAAGAAMGWLSAPAALAVLFGAIAVGAMLLVRRRRAARAREAEAAERLWRRADGPWPAYDRRRSAATEPFLASPPPSATAEPHRDHQPAE